MPRRIFLMKAFFRSITPFEYALWGGAVAAIVISFFICGNTAYYNLFGSILGATALIFVAKGNVLGQILCVLFAAYYGFVSFGIRYYGEMITYLCMSAPIAIAAVIGWLRHPFREGKEVEVSHPKWWEYALILLLAGIVSLAFYFILRALNTANLLVSTFSVATSFTAAVLTLRRSPYYAVAYACNDIVLIVLWSMAAARSTEYIALVVCFSVFLLEDAYGFLSWLLRAKRQRAEQ